VAVLHVPLNVQVQCSVQLEAEQSALYRAARRRADDVVPVSPALLSLIGVSVCFQLYGDVRG
jgi:hypothetical protein